MEYCVRKERRGSASEASTIPIGFSLTRSALKASARHGLQSVAGARCGLKTRVASLARFRVAARKEETRHPHCKFPPSEYCPSSLRQPTSTICLHSLRRCNVLPRLHDCAPPTVHFNSSSSILLPVHNSGACARGRFFSSGRLSTMTTTSVG